MLHSVSKLVNKPASVISHEYDQLDGISKRHVQQCPDGVAQSACHALGGMAEEACQRHNCKGIHGKYHPRWHTGEVCKVFQSVTFSQSED